MKITVQRDDRAGDLVHGVDRRFADAVTLRKPALDVLQDDDRVIDDDANGKDQAE